MLKIVLFLVASVALMHFWGTEPAKISGQIHRHCNTALNPKRGSDGVKVSRKIIGIIWIKGHPKLNYYIHSVQVGITRTLVKAWYRLTGMVTQKGIAFRTSATRKSPAASVPPALLAPPCDLKRLNNEYVALLAANRHRASPAAPAPRYDAVLFDGARHFAQALERKKTLRHDPTQPCAEMCGTSSEVLTSDPKALAKFIWSSFANSPHHAAIQADKRLVWVSVAATGHKFVVRLNYHPTAPGE